MQADDVRPRHQPVNVGFKCNAKLILNTRRKAVAFVVNDTEAKGFCPHGHSFANTTKPDDTQRLAANAMTKHTRRAPTAPFAAAHHPLPFTKAAGHIQDKRHR